MKGVCIKSSKGGYLRPGMVQGVLSNKVAEDEDHLRWSARSALQLLVAYGPRAFVRRVAFVLRMPSAEGRTRK